MLADQPWALTTGRRMITMKHIRVKVDRIWPCDCARSGINCHLRKVGRLPQLVEKTPAEGIFKVELPDESVSKGQAKSEVSQMFDLRNPSKRSHFHSLPKTLEAPGPAPFPVCDKFCLSQCHPISNQTSGILRKCPRHDGAVADPYHGLVPGVESVNVGGTVVLPVHVDGDAINSETRGTTASYRRAVTLVVASWSRRSRPLVTRA